jgi:hypothetical protein
MQISPSLVQQPGWISGAAGVRTALSTVSPHAQVDEVCLAGLTKHPNHANAAVIRAVDESTVAVADRFALTNNRNAFTETHPRRAAGRR